LLNRCTVLDAVAEALLQAPFSGTDVH